MVYHLTLVRMTIIEKSRNRKCWKRFGERGTQINCWWECKLLQHYEKQYGGSSKHRVAI